MDGTSIELWFYEIRDASTGRWRKTSYRMTEQDARRIDWTREVRDGDPEANSTSSFQRGALSTTARKGMPVK